MDATDSYAASHNTRWHLVYHTHRYQYYYALLAAKYRKKHHLYSKLIVLLGAAVGIVALPVNRWSLFALEALAVVIVGLASWVYSNNWLEKALLLASLSDDAHVAAVKAETTWRRALEVNLSEDEQNAQIGEVQTDLVNLATRATDVAIPLDERIQREAESRAAMIMKTYRPASGLVPAEEAEAEVEAAEPL